MGLFDWLVGETLSASDREASAAIEAAEAALAKASPEAALELSAACRPEAEGLVSRLVDLRVRAGLRLRDLMLLRSLAPQASALGRLFPDKARLLMLEAEGAGAIELAQALVDGLAAAGVEGPDLERVRRRKAGKGAGKELLVRAQKALDGRFEDVRLMQVAATHYVVSAKIRGGASRNAIKFLDPHTYRDPAAVKRLEREAEMLLKLHHPGILQLIDLHLAEPPYLVTQFFDGLPLATLVEQGRPFSGREVARIGLQLAEALAHAHEREVVHRDVNPAVVLVDPSLKVKLGDFGLARPLTGWNVTVKGAAVGDWAYEAPELFDGSAARADPSMDVFGVGATLHYVITGKAPWVANDGLTRTRAPGLDVAAPGIDPALREAVRIAVNDAPGDRWPTMDEFRMALAGAAGA